MTYKALREKISGSDNYEHFKSLNITVNCPHLDFQKQFEGINDIYRFFRQQAQAWEKVNNEIPGTLKNSKNHFSNLRDRIANFVEQNLNVNGNALQNNWRNLSNQLKRRKTMNGGTPIFLAEAPETSYLIEIYNDYPEAFGGLHEFIVTPDNQNIDLRNASPSKLKGYILGYEFRLQDHTEIQQRRDNEKISLGHIRSKYEDYLQQAEKDLQDTIKKTKANYDEYVQAIDELEKAKEESFEKWFGQSKQDFISFFENAKEDAQNLREVYRERLRFAGPVEYWQERASDMKQNGEWWMRWFGGSIILAASSIFLLLWLVPDSMTASLFKGDPEAIKWTLLFVTFISFLAYGVRTFSKLTFSSYHLARDAEEREQLTHIYLALKKDSNVEEEDRHLILQALFSRAETGLLKDDAAPTMPASVLEKFRNI
ncbi:DUF6161 domain-containing protein [Fodinibius salsisoli]|uniref:DUF6161 domain-containing protein n=1 Tax=Fodinibius salsisoli TaxID=2820877 RepID=A0ABT3PQ27_9BACT|nr:DUF6161 domain-containing protein [Fodinibius salsisoli]MCW9707962.1 hypothetical protein [Fodinibius salsisoli]